MLGLQWATQCNLLSAHPTVRNPNTVTKTQPRSTKLCLVQKLIKLCSLMLSIQYRADNADKHRINSCLFQ